MWMQQCVMRQVRYISIISVDVSNFLCMMPLQGVTVTFRYHCCSIWSFWSCFPSKSRGCLPIKYLLSNRGGCSSRDKHCVVAIYFNCLFIPEIHDLLIKYQHCIIIDVWIITFPKSIAFCRQQFSACMKLAKIVAELSATGLCSVHPSPVNMTKDGVGIWYGKNADYFNIYQTKPNPI